MRVALIYPVYGHKRFSENLRFIDEEFCKAPPIVLAYVAAVLERAGHAVKIIDAHTRRLPDAQVLEEIRVFGAQLLGVRLETYCFHDTLRLMRYLRPRLPGIRTLAGGLNLSLYPRESFACGLFDCGLIGDAPGRLPRLLEIIERGGDVHAVPGTVSWDGKTVRVEEGGERAAPFDELPFPARGLLDNTLYYSAVSQRRNYTVMLTSRGCPHRCRFCAISGAAYSFRPAARIIEEIEECYHRHGVREIDFFDAVFFQSRGNIGRVLDELARLKLDLEWSCRSRVDAVDEQLLRRARRAGCRQIYFGIESCEEPVLRRIGKGIDTGQARNALAMCRKAGIRTLGFFMLDNPGDTRETIGRTIRYAGSLPLDFAQFSMAIAKPGSEYDRGRIEKTGRDFWREYVAGMVDERPFPRPWSVLADGEVEGLARRAYRSFYLRGRIVFRFLLRLRSPGEWARLARVGWRLARETVSGRGG